MPRGGAGSLPLRRARLRAALWRFRTLPYAEALFAGVPSPCVLTRRYFGFRLALDVSRATGHGLLYLEGERYLAEAPILRRLLRPGMRVVDVGANIGYYLLAIERLVGPGGKVVCLEPEPDNLRELTRNARTNHLDNVEILPCAAGASDGTARLRRGVNGVVVGRQAEGIEVSQRRLDSLVEGPVDVLKIDVEGCEGAVLEGAGELLRAQRPTLFVEVHPRLVPGPDGVGEVVRRIGALYPRLEGYTAASQASLPAKLRARYLGRGTTRRWNLSDLVAAATTGRGFDSFWLVARAPSRDGS